MDSFIYSRLSNMELDVEAIELYLNKNLDGMVESHLMGWFFSEYHGKLKENVVFHLGTQDESVELEAAANQLQRELLSEEEYFLSERFKEAVVERIEFVNGVAVGFWNSLEVLVTCGKDAS